MQILEANLVIRFLECNRCLEEPSESPEAEDEAAVQELSVERGVLNFEVAKSCRGVKVAHSCSRRTAGERTAGEDGAGSCTVKSNARFRCSGVSLKRSSSVFICSGVKAI